MPLRMQCCHVPNCSRGVNKGLATVADIFGIQHHATGENEQQKGGRLSHLEEVVPLE